LADEQQPFEARADHISANPLLFAILARPKSLQRTVVHVKHHISVFATSQSPKALRGKQKRGPDHSISSLAVVDEPS
jgi:hypothetical protein